MSEPVEVTCPCCATKLVVDRSSGEVLAEERPRVDHVKSFETALDQVRGGERRREDAFSKAFDKTQRLDELLSKKFEEAKKKAEKDGAQPLKPFDLD